jgi:NhaP-type Na+/H+ or K+/H+ antiporter
MSVGPTVASVAGRDSLTVPAEGLAMISVLIGVLIICVVGAICFWAIEKFVGDRRLANLLKLLVVLICLAAILQRVLPLAGIY